VRVAYSRDLFAPGGIDVMVMRSLDSPRPARIAGSPSGPPAGSPAGEGERTRRPRRTANP
jgi:hypothetical protein